MSSVREIVKSYQDECLRADITPERAAEIKLSLSSLLGNIDTEMLKKEMVYNKLLVRLYEENKKVANRAELLSKITDEYEQWMEARNTEKLALKLISGLNTYLKAKEEEYKRT